MVCYIFFFPFGIKQVAYGCCNAIISKHLDLTKLNLYGLFCEQACEVKVLEYILQEAIELGKSPSLDTKSCDTDRTAGW